MHASPVSRRVPAERAVAGFPWVRFWSIIILKLEDIFVAGADRRNFPERSDWTTAKELGQAPVGKLLWKYFVPAIIGVLANILYNLVDRIYIGRGVGALALSGLTVTFPIMIIAMAFGMLVGMGSASLPSIRLGEKNRAEAGKILGHAFVLLLGTSPAITALAIRREVQRLNGGVHPQAEITEPEGLGLDSRHWQDGFLETCFARM